MTEQELKQNIHTGMHSTAAAAGGKTSRRPSIGCLWWQP